MGRILQHFLHALVISATLFVLSCHGQGKEEKIVNNAKSEPKLGLLATQLGLNPVGTGYTPDSQSQLDIPSQDYLPTGGAPEPVEPAPAASGYSIDTGGGIQGGNLISPNQCQCIPVEQCPYLNGGDGPVPGGSGGAYGVGDGSQQGSGGQHGGNIPIDGNYGGSQGQQGGNLPVIGGGDKYVGQGQGGQHGGNIPVIGTGGGDYGNEGQHGGNIPVSPGHGGDGGAPNTDGSGLLDLRIVNRPPRPGGVQCLNGQVFCCDLGNGNPGSGSGPVLKPDYPGPGGSGGYVTCGARNYIDVPGKQLEYGDAKFGAYPWMAVILGKGNNYVGAGALISPYYVLTAAHKIKGWKPGAAMKVRLGEWNAKEDDEPYKNVEIDVESVLIHPGFNAQNLQNDVALVRLAHPVDIQGNPHIKTVCLPQQGYQYMGQRCWVAGFGKDAFGNGKHSYIMKEVDLPILDSNDCENRLRTTRLGKYFQLNRYSFLCAGGEEGKDACTGDGGSPLVCQNAKGGFEAVGLVAWGIGCADYGIPGVYVNLPNYADWINEEIYRY